MELIFAGPIVRINPHELHINDPDFFDELYAGGKRDKYQWWVNVAGAPGSGFATVGHDLHRLRRGALSPFFSKRSVTQLEPVIKQKIEKLSKRFETASKTGEVIRLDAAFMALTMDVICDYSFANDRKYLDEDDFKLEWKETVMGAFSAGALTRQFPWLEELLKSLPRPIVKAVNKNVHFFFQWRDGVEAQVVEILEHRETKTTLSTRTIFHTLRDGDLPPQEKTLERLCDEGEILTGAGSETTASALSKIWFYLCENPDKLRKLREEVVRAMPDPDMLPPWSTLEQLPYIVNS